MEILIHLGQLTLEGEEAEFVFQRAKERGRRFWYHDELYEVLNVVVKLGQTLVIAREIAPSRR